MKEINRRIEAKKALKISAKDEAMEEFKQKESMFEAQLAKVSIELTQSNSEKAELLQ